MKGMLIICVVYYHVVTNPVLIDLKPFYVSYFMASFFFVSGYFYKINDSMLAVINKKSRLLIPLALIAYPCMVLKRLFVCDCLDVYTIFVEPFKLYFCSAGLWFINCLFCGHVILAFFVLMYKRLSDWTVLFFFSLSFAVMLFVNQNREVHLFFEFQTAVIMQFFMIAGFFFKQHNWINYVARCDRILLFLCLYIIIIAFFYNDAGVFDVHLNNYGKIWLYLPLAFLGTFIVAGLSTKINKSRMLILLGRQSLVIYIFHVSISLHVKSGLFLIARKFDVINICSLNSVVDYVACCCSLIISFLIACLLDRYCPFLLGKRGRDAKNNKLPCCQ